MRFQEWSERCAANEDGFSVDVVSTMLHEELLLSAEAEYDATEAAKSKKVPLLFYLLCAFFLAPCAQADNQANGHKTHSKGYGESFALRATSFVYSHLQLVQARDLAKAKPEVSKAMAKKATEKQKALAKARPRSTLTWHEVLHTLPTIAIRPRRVSHN